MPFRHRPETKQLAVDLVRQGVPPSQAARQVGADPSTVYDWLHDAAPDLVRQLRCWRCDPDVSCDRPAYAHLLGLYLGDGWLLPARGAGWSLNVACCDAYPGLMAECESSMRAVLATSTCRVRRVGCHDVKAYSRHWPCLLPQHGPGRKHERQIRLEPWQQVLVAEEPGRLLRGLFHSDGWRGDNVAVHRKGGTVVRYRYPRYEFTNRSDDIRRICTDALDQLGVAWRPNGRWRVSVSRREAVAALDEHVGPKY